MKADKLGVLSALMASMCCITPLVLVLLGLGSLGIGAVLGRFHWWFLLGAIGLLTSGWRIYFRERGHCRTTGCEMPRQRTTRIVLGMTSLIVTTFVGLHLYTYASQRAAPSERSANTRLASVVLPVKGMTCLTCELTLESSLKRLPGVLSADAGVVQQAVAVTYNPTQVTVEQLIATINQTGYEAGLPSHAGKADDDND